jgi:hypothetical protein
MGADYTQKRFSGKGQFPAVAPGEGAARRGVEIAVPQNVSTAIMGVTRYAIADCDQQNGVGKRTCVSNWPGTSTRLASRADKQVMPWPQWS